MKEVHFTFDAKVCIEVPDEAYPNIYPMEEAIKELKGILEDSLNAKDVKITAFWWDYGREQRRSKI